MRRVPSRNAKTAVPVPWRSSNPRRGAFFFFETFREFSPLRGNCEMAFAHRTRRRTRAFLGVCRKLATRSFGASPEKPLNSLGYVSRVAPSNLSVTSHRDKNWAGGNNVRTRIVQRPIYPNLPEAASPTRTAASPSDGEKRSAKSNCGSIAILPCLSMKPYWPV
jgi:hypothetical protein